MGQKTDAYERDVEKGNSINRISGVIQVHKFGGSLKRIA